VSWWRRLLGRRRLDRELDAEVADHLDRRTRDHVRAGMSPDEARRRARLEFGAIEGVKDASRDTRGTKWSLDLARDVRQAVRSLRGTPSFTIVAVVVLALGIGASTAMYSVADAVVLRGLPFARSDRLVGIRENLGALTPDGGNPVQPQNFLDWRAQQDVFTGIAASSSGDAIVTLRREGAADPMVLRGERVTAEFFPILGVAPVLGRTFTSGDEVAGRDRVAVISYGLWQRRFGGASDVVGKRLPDVQGDLDIVGVMPASFVYPLGTAKHDEVWIPLTFQPEERVHSANGMSAYLQVIARLRDGVTIDQARARLTQITDGVMAASPGLFSRRITPVVDPLQEWLVGAFRPWIRLLLVAVGLVLLSACVNVANLLLVRATTRTREIGVRAALGATRWDLVRALLVESLLLSLVAAALGVLVAASAVTFLRDAMPAGVPRASTIAINLRVLGITSLAALVTGLLFGLAPALQLSRTRISAALVEHGRSNTASRSRQWLRGVLVVVEVALAGVLVVGAALFITSFLRMTRVPLGLDYHDVVTLSVRPRTASSDTAGRKAIADRLHVALPGMLARVAVIPGVTIASVSSGVMPLSGGISMTGIQTPAGEHLTIEPNQISPRYLEALRVPLLAGRWLTDADDEHGQPVVILNQAAVAKIFPDGRALGQTIQADSPRVVIGIVGTIRDTGPTHEGREAMYTPIAQGSAAGFSLVLRTEPDAGLRVLPAAQRAVWADFPDLAFPEAKTLEQYLETSLAQQRLNMLLLGLFGTVALAIAAVGLYGVMAYAVAQRTQEIGVRMALGAVPAMILRSVLGRAGGYVLLGLALGLAGAWELARFAQTFLFQIQPHDTRMYIGAGAVLAAAGLVAALVPARRAARVDPVIALRGE
jgi:predicted permease